MILGAVYRMSSRIIKWIIPDFFSDLSYRGKSTESPCLMYGSESYSIHLHTVGNYINIGLTFIKKEKSHNRLYVKLRTVSGYGERLDTYRGETDSYGKFCVKRWMTVSKMADRRYKGGRDNTLIIYCYLRNLNSGENMLQEQLPRKEVPTFENTSSDSDSDDGDGIHIPKGFKKLLGDMKNLLVSGEDSDVTIKVRGKEFPAHRSILRLRSPVFKCMFSHDTKERESGVVVIEDCDPVTFPDFLSYMYTGDTRHICSENVFGLYAASDKYATEDLKDECVSFMQCNLSVETFCDVITLALRHDEEELFDLARDFFCRNKREIIQTSKWETFLHENTKVGNRLFIVALSKK